MKDTTQDSNTDMQAQLDLMKAAYIHDTNPSYDTRLERLNRLEKALLEYEPRLIAAMSADFSYRSETESRNYDITTSLGELRSNRRHLRKWMKPQRYPIPMHLRPARGKVIPQPLGVVGIIAPWNFPVYLAISPLVPALAAGNRAMLKLSEVTPQTAEVLKEMIEAHFDPLEISVYTGGPDVAIEFSSLAFDHLLFTGSTTIGRHVAIAAARNLTPVTLELGGKSPCIVGENADLKYAARRIAFGKCINAGQICIGPDYALVPRAKMDEFAGHVEGWLRKFYPSFQNNPDFTAIVSDPHRARLQAMVKEAEDRGTKTIRLEDTSTASCRLESPTLLIDPPLDIQAMREEVFGPILSIIPYDSKEDALALIMARDRPLAMYVFTDDKAERDFWLTKSIAGGVCVNETVFHVSADTLPFGGVGASGIGAYHGIKGFETFSHMKPIFYQPKLNGVFMFEPPVKGFKARVSSIFRKLV